MDFFTRYNSPPAKGEPNSGVDCKVDPKGYIPMVKQIERMILAGERLVAFRREEFDSFTSDEPGEPSFFSNPDIIPSVDVPHEMERRIKKANSSLAQKQENTPSVTPSEPASDTKDTVKED